MFFRHRIFRDGDYDDDHALGVCGRVTEVYRVAEQLDSRGQAACKATGSPLDGGTWEDLVEGLTGNGVDRDGRGVRDPFAIAAADQIGAFGHGEVLEDRRGSQVTLLGRSRQLPVSFGSPSVSLSGKPTVPDGPRGGDRTP